MSISKDLFIYFIQMSLNAYINEASDVLFRFDLFTIPHSSSNFNICADERTRQKMFEYLGEFEETDERGNVTLLSVLEHKLSEERHVCSQQLRLQSSQMLKFLTGTSKTGCENQRRLKCFVCTKLASEIHTLLLKAALRYNQKLIF